jgi:hypothetical protein
MAKRIRRKRDNADDGFEDVGRMFDEGFIWIMGFETEMLSEITGQNNYGGRDGGLGMVFQTYLGQSYTRRRRPKSAKKCSEPV